MRTKRCENALKCWLVAFQPLDVGLTAYALFYLEGAREMNPLLSWLAGSTPAAFCFFLMLKVGLALRICSGTVATPRDWALLWGVVLLYGGTISWNAANVVGASLHLWWQ
jgi:hypothetical protein